MSRNPASHDLPESSAVSSPSGGEEFLRTEYTLLNEWAIHGEDVAHRIFNFYITLLTTILGGLFVVIQLLTITFQASLIIVGSACGFLLILGAGFYDALVAQYIQNAYYHAGMSSIRLYFRRYQETGSSLLELPSFLSEAIAKESYSSLTKRLIAVKIGLPAGNQLALMGAINSLLVGISIWCLAWGIGGVGFRPFDTILTSVICFFLSSFIHSRLANLMIKRNLTEIAQRMASQKGNITSESISAPFQKVIKKSSGVKVAKSKASNPPSDRGTNTN